VTLLSQSQVRQYASNAGFTGSNLNIATAIAMAESGGNTQAVNTSDPYGGSFGLFQINAAHFHAGGTTQACALDPQCASNYAYSLFKSQGFQPWGTYTNGAYQKFMGTASSSTGVQPWFTFPRVDNFGQIDPQGNFYKPDSNIQLPGGYPITALLSGTVTSLQPTTSWGQSVATIKLDTPLNSLATHTFYEHMSGFAPGLSVGQHVNAGDLIGYNNPSGQVPLGFGLYSGDVYGSGSAWSTLQQDLAPGGAGLLNPTNLLNAAAQTGGTWSGTGVLSYNPSGLNTSTGCQWYDIPCWFQNQVESLLISSGFVIFGLVLLLVGIIILFIGHGGSVEVAGTGVGVGQGGSAPG
jgi:murein DD-endopeptidase MepM/ murein hydrolase activator NlpD